MTPKSEIDPLDLLAEEFVERLRRGERPAVEEYAGRMPDAAERIRELFPALAAMEGAAAALTGDGISSAPTETESRPLPERIGDYRILREVGRGGMGVVYEAEQESLGRHVALKVLLPEYQSRTRFVQRFRREAKAAGRLHHTNIVPVFGVGESDGTLYYVMQYIDGVGLDQVIRDVRRLRRDAGEPIAPEPPTMAETLSVSVAQGLIQGDTEKIPSIDSAITAISGESSQLAKDGSYFRSAARLALQAARALAHAHNHGIIHRDVKPSNFLLDIQGNLWVTDFGLAKTDETSELTGSHDILGTMRYMSPERFAGEPIDARADVYSLGLMLYEMLTLRPAFSEYDRLQLIQRIGQGNFRRPREVDPRIPRDLETIILKAAAREPKDRYKTARDLAEDLELFLANRPIKSRRASNWEHLRRWARRNPVVAGLAGTVAALLFAITLLTLVSNARLGQTNLDLDAKKTALGIALDEQGQLRAQAQDQAWEANIQATRAGHFSGREGQRIKGLANLAKAMELKPGHAIRDVRNEAVGCLVLPDLEVVKEFPWPYGTTMATFTRDLSRYARLDTEGKVVIHRVEDNQLLFEIPVRGPHDGYHAWSFSPDGRYLWHHEVDKWRVWDVGGDRAIEVLELTAGRQAGIAFTADSSRLALVDWEAANKPTTLRLFNLREPDPARRKKPVHEVVLSTATAKTIWAHPTRPDVLLLTGDSRMTVYDVSGPDPTLSWSIPESVSWVAWHPDGDKFAISGNASARRLYVCSAETGAILSTMEGHKNNGIVVWFDPAGDRLWSADWNNQVRLWDWRAGRQIFETSATLTLPPVVTPDGTLTGLIRNDHVQVCRFADGREATRLAIPANVPVGKATSLGPPVLSPDGRLLAAPCEDFVALFDLPARELVGTIPLYRAMPFQFEADGAGLLLNATYGGQNGLFRIPLTRTESRVDIGAPQLALATKYKYMDVFGISGDGHVVVVPLAASGDGALLYTQPKRVPTPLPKQHDVRFCSVSPNGKWAITGSHGHGHVVLWDAETGKRLKELEDWGGHSSFSPDGRWACTYRSDTPRARIWDTTTWESGPSLAGQRGVFSPDGKYLAIGGDPGVVRLLRVPSGEEVVRLPVPENVRFEAGCFTPDGGTLAARPIGAAYVQVWDVHAIRRQLRPMGLDWDDSPIPDAPPEPFRYPAPLTVAGPPPAPPSKSLPIISLVDKDPQAEWIMHSLTIAQNPLHPGGYLGRGASLVSMNRLDEAMADAEMAIRLAPRESETYRLRGRVRRAGGDSKAALADFHRAVEFGPASRAAHAERANTAQQLRDDPTFLESARRMTELSPRAFGWWQALAAGLLVAEAPLRDVDAARVAAGQAARLNATNAFNHTVVGYAMLESGRLEDAEKAFAESRRLRPPGNYDALNLFGLALCAHAGDDAAKSRTLFAQAVAVKDSGRLHTDLAERLMLRMYAQAAKALELPPPRR